MGKSPALRPERAHVPGCHAVLEAAAARGHAREAAHRIGHLLPALRPTARRPRGEELRAPRRRREPDPLAARRRPQPQRVRRPARNRAVRIVPLETDAGHARGRIPADPRDGVRRLERSPLPGGVVRRPRARNARAGQLRPADRRCGLGARRDPASRDLGTGVGDRPRQPRRAGPKPSRLLSGRPCQRLLDHVSRRLGTDEDDLRRLVQPSGREPIAAARRGHVRSGPRGGRRFLAEPSRRGRFPGRAGRAGARRRAEPADPGADTDVAVQHRQQLPGAVVPRRARRRRGDGELRLRRRHPGDAAQVAPPARPRLLELEDRRRARRNRPLLPALR